MLLINEWTTRSIFSKESYYIFQHSREANNYKKDRGPSPWSVIMYHVRYNILSHTWVRYPGFSGHGIKCPILTTVVPGFPAIWLAVPFGANGVHLGICTLPEKKTFSVWNKLFLCEIKFSQKRTRPVKSLWWQIVPMQESTNEWKNLTIF